MYRQGYAPLVLGPKVFGNDHAGAHGDAIKKPTIMKIRLPDEVTAARAASSRNLPTIRGVGRVVHLLENVAQQNGQRKNSSFSK